MKGNEACAGQKQAPINIVTSTAKYQESMGNLIYTGYNLNPTAMKLKNNGHTGRWILLL